MNRNRTSTLQLQEPPILVEADHKEYVLSNEADIVDISTALSSYTGPVLIQSRYSVGKMTLICVLLNELLSKGNLYAVDDEQLVKST